MLKKKHLLCKINTFSSLISKLIIITYKIICRVISRFFFFASFTIWGIGYNGVSQVGLLYLSNFFKNQQLVIQVLRVFEFWDKAILWFIFDTLFRLADLYRKVIGRITSRCSNLMAWEGISSFRQSFNVSVSFMNVSLNNSTIEA